MQERIERTIWLAAVAAVSLLIASPAMPHGGGHGSAAVERTPGPPTTVAFYELPGCPICSKINGWLDELQELNPGAATVVRKSSTEPQNKDEMLARGIEHHGVAILDGQGGVVWVEQAHVLTRATLEQEFRDHVVADRVIQRREVGCGACIYGMPGVKGCVAAVRVDTTPRLIDGVEVEAHAAGLCSGPKLARVAGHVEGERFAATFVEIE